MSQKTPQRVKVEEASYDEKSDTISWVVKILDGPNAQKTADLIWLRADFGPTFKINTLIPIPLVKEFCQNMIGKEINVLSDDSPTEQQANMGEMKEKFKEWLQDQ
jgi:hypothetical protein